MWDVASLLCTAILAGFEECEGGPDYDMRRCSISNWACIFRSVIYMKAKDEDGRIMISRRMCNGTCEANRRRAERDLSGAAQDYGFLTGRRRAACPISGIVA